MNAVGSYIDHPAVGEIYLRFEMNGLFSAVRCLAVGMNAEILSENALGLSDVSLMFAMDADCVSEDSLAEFMNAVVASAHPVVEFILALFCAEVPLCVWADSLVVFSDALCESEDVRGAEEVAELFVRGENKSTCISWILDFFL